MEGMSDDFDEEFTYADANEKIIRRRSSKACDQCRKHKTKCRMNTEEGRCENCALLGFTCTFLGPSRKRGPPKGYLDAIEARFNQLEALLGVIVLSKDPRAQSLLNDLRHDTLARELIARVDDSQFGTRGRSEGSSEVNSSTSATGAKAKRGTPEKLIFTTPDDPTVQTARDWQDRLAKLIQNSTHRSSVDVIVSPPQGKIEPDTDSFGLSTLGPQPSWSFSRDASRMQQFNSTAPQLSSSLSAFPMSVDSIDTSRQFGQGSRNLSFSSLDGRDDATSHWRTAGSTGSQRRRLDSVEERGEQWNRLPGSSMLPPNLPPFDPSSSTGRTSIESTPSPLLDPPRNISSASSPASVTQNSALLPSDNPQFAETDDVADYVGQLSLDENEHLRYHGRASGLHLLARTAGRTAGRHQDGLWKFPKAGVWPAVDDGEDAGMSPESTGTGVGSDGLSTGYTRESSLETGWDPTSGMPPKDEQEKLLELYFAYIHPVLPVLHRADFMKSWRAMHSKPSEESEAEKQEPIAPILLFAIFSLAARYVGIDKASIAPGKMTRAGIAYYEKAREILCRDRIPSRQSTCQAMLLITYRDIGVGSMVQAWHAMGIAIRTAQDIGLHRSLDKWQPAGANRFSTQEKKTFRRIWYSCVIMDQYVSTYIGRPISTFSQDFDTPLPEDDEDDGEDSCLWQPPPGILIPGNYVPAPNRIVSCFRASAILSSLVEEIISLVYSIRPTTPDRCRDYNILVGKLDKWLLELPEGLRYEPSAKYQLVPPPHILSLHMAYWCAIILINRPFLDIKSAESPLRSSTQYAERSYAMCETAAIRISDIVHAYSETFTLERCPAFFSYYVFTASIMHLTVLASNPDNVLANERLERCMNALDNMKVLWPSAGRAHEILDGSRANVHRTASSGVHHEGPLRSKRAAEDEPSHERRESFPTSVVTEDIKPLRHTRSVENVRERLAPGPPPLYSSLTAHHAYPTKVSDFSPAQQFSTFTGADAVPGSTWTGPDLSYRRNPGVPQPQPPLAPQAPSYLSTPMDTQASQYSTGGVPVMQFWDNSTLWDGFGDSSSLSAYFNQASTPAYSPPTAPKRSSYAPINEFTRRGGTQSGVRGPVYTYDMSNSLQRM